MAVQRWERLEASSGDHQTRSWWNRRSAKVCTEIGCNCLSFPWHHQQWYPWFLPVRSPLLRKKSKLTSAKHLRANVSMRQTNSGKSPKFVFTPTFIFCSPICSNNCGVVFFVKIYFSFRKIIFFVQPLKYANFHRGYYPSCVTSCNECTRPTVFLWTWSFVLPSKLKPLSLLKLAEKYLFFGEYFCPTYFSYVEK